MTHSTLVVLALSTHQRVAVAVSLNRDLKRVSEYSDHCGIKLNKKTETMIVSMPHTMRPQSPTLALGRTVLNQSADLDILLVTFDIKMTFEKQLHTVSRTDSKRLCVLKKS